MDDPLVKTLEGGLARVWAAQGRRFLSVSWDADGGERFVQYLDGELNVAWSADEPLERAAERCRAPLPRGVFVLARNPATTILAVGDLRQHDLAAWMTDLVRSVLGLERPELPDLEVLEHR